MRANIVTSKTSIRKRRARIRDICQEKTVLWLLLRVVLISVMFVPTSVMQVQETLEYIMPIEHGVMAGQEQEQLSSSQVLPWSIHCCLATLSLHSQMHRSLLNMWVFTAQASLISSQAQPHSVCSSILAWAHSFSHFPVFIPHFPSITGTLLTLLIVAMHPWLLRWHPPLHCWTSTCVGLIWNKEQWDICRDIIIVTCCISVLFGQGSFIITGLGLHSMCLFNACLMWLDLHVWKKPKSLVFNIKSLSQFPAVERGNANTIEINIFAIMKFLHFVITLTVSFPVQLYSVTGCAGYPSLCSSTQ